MELDEEIAHFFVEQRANALPVLLGFSGGEDSLVLASCMLQLEIPFEIAHFDHAWRETSQAEASELARWAEERGIRFHSKRSTEPSHSELDAREERYHFFLELFRSGRYEALVLAHHEADLVETILKRVLEGANLNHLKGIGSISCRMEMPVWRPMLRVKKEQILLYIEKNGLEPIDDPTNRDPKYLRARLRSKLLPSIAKDFGKEIVPALLKIGREAIELDAYLKEKTLGCIPISGPFGLMWDFSTLHPIEIRYILKKAFKAKDIVPSEKIFSRVFSAIASGKANVGIVFSGQKIIIDRKNFFWIARPLPEFSEEIPLRVGSHLVDGWSFHIQTSDNHKAKKGGWLDFWRGELTFPIRSEDSLLVPSNKFFLKRWNEKKIPAFLRPMIGCVRDVRGKTHDPLERELSQKDLSSQILLKIEISVRD